MRCRKGAISCHSQVLVGRVGWVARSNLEAKAEAVGDEVKTNPYWLMMLVQFVRARIYVITAGQEDRRTEKIQERKQSQRCVLCVWCVRELTVTATATA